MHVPSELIARFDPEWGASLLGDKAHSMIFDNSKVKRLIPGYVARIPYEQGAREIIAWHDADPARRQVNDALNGIIERILEAYGRAWPDKNPGNF